MPFKSKPKAKPKPKQRTLELVGVRDALRAKLSASEKKQLAVVLKGEQLGSIDEAREDDELSIQLVDVMSGSEPKYQLYLWPFGSAALFAAGSTKQVGGASQHAFVLELGDAADLAALEAAWKAAKKKLKLGEALTFESAVGRKGGAKKAAGKAETSGSVSERIAEIRRVAAGGDRRKANKLCEALGLFPAWRVYPKLLPDDLSAEQRALLELILDHELDDDLQSSGLFERTAWLERFLGRTEQGPSDSCIPVGARSVPIWWAVASVGSGHARPDDVQRGWMTLPTAKAVAAWKEIATDQAYDVLQAHWTSMKDASFYGKPYQKDYRTRVVTLLADVSLALGRDGEKAAAEIAKKLPSWGGAAQVFIALTSGLGHAKARGAELDPAFDKTFKKLWERVSADSFHAPAVESEIEKSLPGARAKAFRAGLTRPD